MHTPFQIEAWIEYGLGVAVLFLRFFARWKVVGFKKWEGDDYFAILVLVFWTLEFCMLQLIGQYGTNIGVTDEIAETLTREQISRFETGSKFLLAGINFYVSCIWSLKGCMLCFYNRLTFGLRQQLLVKWTGVACVVAYAAVMAAIWGHCTPVHKNWQVVPNPGANYVTIVVMNVTTDIAILAIPLPLLWTVRITPGRKIVTGILLCSGVFTIVATSLHCAMSLRDIQGINNSTIWAIRETIVGIIAVNAVAIKPLFAKSRWIASSKDSSGATQGHSQTQNQYSLDNMRGGVTSTIASKRRFNKDITYTGENSSDEHIVTHDKFEYNRAPRDQSHEQQRAHRGSVLEWISALIVSPVANQNIVKHSKACVVNNEGAVASGKTFSLASVAHNMPFS
ncbi:allantoate permease [Purpureocillium lavendulum]|uniref:Allantoate permease n=1 Tax=Purpureocillium lavendulum TaxID=1247861 RepID=A0AB34FWR0_9HYPO|nr:allantoate permease [Purpureocillium lavendulum]